MFDLLNSEDDDLDIGSDFGELQLKTTECMLGTKLKQECFIVDITRADVTDGSIDKAIVSLSIDIQINWCYCLKGEVLLGLKEVTRGRLLLEFLYELRSK